jgi:hypothetical protein
MTYTHIHTSSPQPNDSPEIGKWVVYCLHIDEAGEHHTFHFRGNKKKEMTKKNARYACDYCHGATDY